MGISLWIFHFCEGDIMMSGCSHTSPRHDRSGVKLLWLSPYNFFDWLLCKQGLTSVERVRMSKCPVQWFWRGNNSHGNASQETWCSFYLHDTEVFSYFLYLLNSSITFMILGTCLERSWLTPGNGKSVTTHMDSTLPQLLELSVCPLTHWTGVLVRSRRACQE